MAPKKLGIIGIGNTTMGDDGVGVALLEALRDESLPENVSLIDIGTGGLALLHVLARLDAAIILDAVDFGGAPGELRPLSPEGLKSVKQAPGISTHEGDVLMTIEMSRELGECPKTIIILAIQPASMQSSMALSPALAERLPEYSQAVLRMISDIS
jgi:hydrogenase maturation protease